METVTSGLESVFCVFDYRSAAEAIRAFPEHHKLLSWLYLYLLQFPTLQGIILTKWTREAENCVRRWASTLGAEDLLIRSDKAPETGDYPRGGYLVKLSVLPTEVEWFSKQGRVVYLLEPKSPFDDLYSINIEFRVGDLALTYEIVGPGFDASDLKRGDTNPHEVLRLRKSLYTDIESAILDRHVISAQAYKQSWTRRLTKVGRMLSRDKGIELVEEDLATFARTKLKERAEELLLEHENSYKPIPLEFIETVHREVHRLPLMLEDMRLPGEPFTVSLGLLGRHGNRAYWDIVWPQLKYTI